MERVAFTLRPIEEEDIDGCMKLSGDAGWNQTKKDWKLLIENSENTCILAEHDHKIIGTTTAINYLDQIAWIGMVLVDKEYRGQGISKVLLTNVFEKLKACKSIKLDATPEGQKVYKQFDFKDEYIITRMTIASMNKLVDDSDMILPVPVGEEEPGEIITLDEQVFGANRKQLIKSLLKQFPGKGWVLKQSNRVTGFVLGRNGSNYHHVGPVTASNITEAKALITNAFRKLIDQPVVVDVLNDKKDLIAWLNSIGFTRQRHFIRMYKKENPFPGISNNQYLICGPEFG
jgi:GNAT superfamily N-acetyltransferase